MRLVFSATLALAFFQQPLFAQEADIEAESTARFAALALDCVHREYPNKISHVMGSDAHVMPPRELTPVFYGCFDWHSSVHGHWLLARLISTYPDASFAEEARLALAKSLSPDKIAGEVRYLSREESKGFERPYGVAWFLQLTAELRQSNDHNTQAWLENLKPLEAIIVTQLKDWLPKLAYPIRLGTHNQSAFAFGLIHDWAEIAGDQEMARLVEQKSREFHLNDVNCPLAYEPSGEDFLSPCLMEADLMRRFLDQNEYAIWLEKFLPQIPSDGSDDWLEIGIVTDPTDGKLVHLDGVNLSRAWALEGIASGLPVDDRRLLALQATADAHKIAGLAAVSAEHYEGSHWLASFAIYLLTQRGIN